MNKERQGNLAKGEKTNSMELGVGSILEGKVTGITKFGAFVSLGENKSGLVHISEIANTYVNDIHEHLEEGQTVKVKVLAIDENGRINLSIKRAQPPTPAAQGQQGQVRGNGSYRGGEKRTNFTNRQNNGGFRGGNAVQNAAPMTAEESFEAKLKAFMTESEGKISDLNHSLDKRGRRR